MKNIFILTGLALLTFGCSVEKRIHNSGYHISKNSKSLVNKDKSQNTESKHTVVESRGNKETVAQEESKSNANEIKHYSSDVIASTDQDIVFSFESRDIVKLNETCDIIILKDGTEIKAKVLEINEDNVKYKMCDNLDGPTFTKNKGLIFMIKYPNGASTVINADDKNRTIESSKIDSNYEQKEFEPLAAIGFAFNLLSLLILLIEIVAFIIPITSALFGLTGAILLIISSRKFKSNPNKYKGKGFLIAGLVISLISSIIGTLYFIEWLYFF
jgi:hypothetical protein